jgi:hypothetical protein
MRRLACSLLGVTPLVLASPALAQDLRADSPLWTYDAEPNEALFPRSFHDADTFGCLHTIRTGIYRRTSTESSWTDYWRLDNYGVFHCAIVFGEGDDPEEADEAFSDYAWVVELDTITEQNGIETELLALQIGVRSGSEYVLLRRRKGDMERLELLAPECPPDAERRTATIDVWRQDVCVVTSQDQLRAMARVAHGRPAVGQLEFAPPSPEDGTTEEE